jgi:hypothetical protein
MAITLVIAASILLFIALSRGERKAWMRRSQRLNSRDAIARSDWYADLPELQPERIDHALELIGSVLNVRADVLRPDDDLQSDLSVIDGFFCFVEDDDTIECLRDKIEERIGSRPSTDWTKLRDVILEFASSSRLP